MDEVVFSPAVYSFLHYLYRRMPAGDELKGRKVLDCGAGGPRPPIALFARYGLECFGIDISEERLHLAQEYCQSHAPDVDLRLGDAREIPFEDSTFDYVYEFYMLCHLSHADTTKAINEMHRVLKPGGMCFLGFMSPDTWPLTGRWVNEGELVMRECGEDTLHSVFSPAQAEPLLSNFDILLREINEQSAISSNRSTTVEEWEEFYERVEGLYSRDDWKDLYTRRVEKSKYSHTFYVLQKPAE